MWQIDIIIFCSASISASQSVIVLGEKVVTLNTWIIGINRVFNILKREFKKLKII